MLFRGLGAFAPVTHGGGGRTFVTRGVKTTRAWRSATIWKPVPVSASSFSRTRFVSTTTQKPSSNSSRQYEVVGILGLLFLGAAVWNTRTSGVLHLDAPTTHSRIRGAFRVDPSTSQSLPMVLPTPQTPLPESCKDLVLVGLGVRTVSFLRVKVYVAALYIDANALESLSKIPEWRGYEAKWMAGQGPMNSEDLVSTLIENGFSFAIRIVPVRSTDYAHLRDGFTRSIQGRAKLARKAGQIDPETDESLSSSLLNLKEAFPRSSLPKGKALDLIFTPSPTKGLDLTLEEDKNVLGTVKALPGGPAAARFSIGNQLLLAYFANKDEISKPVCVSDVFCENLRLFLYS